MLAQSNQTIQEIKMILKNSEENMNPEEKLRLLQKAFIKIDNLLELDECKQKDTFFLKNLKSSYMRATLNQLPHIISKNPNIGIDYLILLFEHFDATQEAVIKNPQIQQIYDDLLDMYAEDLYRIIARRSNQMN